MRLAIIFAILIGSLSAKAACEKRYIFGFVNTGPSFMVSDQGEKQGHSYSLLRELVERIGCKSSENPASYAANAELFKRNGLDIYGLSIPDSNLENRGEFVEVYRVPRWLIVRKDSFVPGAPISSYFKDKKIIFGSIIGRGLFIKPDEKEELYKDHRIREYPTPAEVYSALKSGKVQAAFTSPVFNYYFVREEVRVKSLVTVLDTDYISPIGFYVSKSRLSPQERNSVRRHLADMKKDGSLQSITKDYLFEEDLKYYSP
ncbi:substrate-binding periplasmic protein [Bdellovibrio sp. HCB290]|uniref:substrate-binding periplasmic protein n=1 Tax=Bdellovibrio sp. HCB290 TaxID=3394356 RepID=UPI0039B42A5E